MYKWKRLGFYVSAWYGCTISYSQVERSEDERRKKIKVSGSISASTPACHAGERGSTPRQRVFFLSTDF
jgi:hypothetical protein